MTRKSDPDGWYDPDGTDAAMLRQIREAGEYRRSDPPPKTGESVGGMDVPPASTSSSLSASGTSPGLSASPAVEQAIAALHLVRGMSVIRDHDRNAKIKAESALAALLAEKGDAT